MDPVLQMVGIAMKAGKVASGNFAVEKAVKSFSAYLVIVSEDTSERSKSDYTKLCDFYELPLYFYSDKSSLGHAIGKESRSSLAITDEKLAMAIEKKLQSKIE